MMATGQIWHLQVLLVVGRQVCECGQAMLNAREHGVAGPREERAIAGTDGVLNTAAVLATVERLICACARNQDPFG